MEEEMSTHLLRKTNNNGNGGCGNPVDTSSSITPKLVLAAFIAILGSLSVGFVIGFTSPVQSEIMEELGFSTAEYSLFGSVIDIGAGLAALVGCKLTDYIGRRCVLGLADISYIIGWLAIAVGQGARLLDLGRLMLGFGLGIAIYAGPIYVSEFTPKNLRGGFVVLSLLLIATGTALVFIIGLIIPWRILALLGLIPSLVQIVALFFIPESPRWLLMMGKDEEFEAALQWFRGTSADVSQEVADIKEGAEALEELSKVTILQLFQKKYAYVLTAGVGLSALPCICGLKGILYYASSIFESAGFSAAVGTVALALFQLPSMVLGMFVLDKFGRRPLLMFSAAGVCLGCLLAGFSFFCQDHHLLKGFSPYLSLIGLLIYYCAYPIGLGGASAVLTTEIYPLNIKWLAGCINSLIGAILGWMVTYTFNFLMAWSSSGTFFIMACNCVVTLVFVAKLVPETKGKTLEEVHMSMSRVWQ